jgi:hypothetical protein
LKTEQLEGRVEHVVSGHSTRFKSLAEFSDFVMQVLEWRQSSSSEPSNSASYGHIQPDVKT